MNIIQQFICAIYRFGKYPELIKNKMWRVILYLLTLSAISYVLIIVLFYPAYKSAGGLTGIINRYVPEFTVSNGKLDMETIEYIDDDIMLYIHIDTTKAIDRSELNKYDCVLLADSDSLVASNGIQQMETKFSDIGEMSKADLIKAIPMLKISMAVSLIMLYLLYVGNLLTMIVLFVLIGNVINLMFVRAQIRFWDMFKLSVYARTMPALLMAVLSVIGVNMSMIIYAGIVCVYMYLGLKNIKAENGVVIADLN